MDTNDEERIIHRIVIWLSLLLARISACSFYSRSFRLYNRIMYSFSLHKQQRKKQKMNEWQTKRKRETSLCCNDFQATYIFLEKYFYLLHFLLSHFIIHFDQKYFSFVLIRLQSKRKFCFIKISLIISNYYYTIFLNLRKVGSSKFIFTFFLCVYFSVYSFMSNLKQFFEVNINSGLFLSSVTVCVVVLFSLALFV